MCIVWNAKSIVHDFGHTLRCHPFVPVADLRVDLGCLDVGVSEHLGDKIDIHTLAAHCCGSGMAQTVKGNVLVRDACILDPLMEGTGNHCPGETCENLA